MSIVRRGIPRQQKVHILGIKTVVMKLYLACTVEALMDLLCFVLRVLCRIEEGPLAECKSFFVCVCFKCY